MMWLLVVSPTSGVDSISARFGELGSVCLYFVVVWDFFFFGWTSIGALSVFPM